MLEEIKNLSIYTNIMCVSFRSLIYSLTRVIVHVYQVAQSNSMWPFFIIENTNINRTTDKRYKSDKYLMTNKYMLV